MFYKQLIRICKERGVKPTPVLKQLGYSPANLKKWAEGATVNSDIVKDLANYFNISTDYFIRDVNPLKMAMCAINAQYDYDLSLITKSYIYEDELESICQYTGLSRDELIDYEDIVVQTDKSSPNLNPIIIISDIFQSLPGSVEFRCIQVRLSWHIIDKLLDIGIGKEELKGTGSNPGYKVGLRNTKIDKLYDRNEDNIREISGFNYSDIINISRKCRVSIEYMLKKPEKKSIKPQ